MGRMRGIAGISVTGTVSVVAALLTFGGGAARAGLASAAPAASGCTVVTSIPVGIAPTGVAVNPNTGLWYVVNQDKGTVSVIKGKTSKVIATVQLFGNAWYAAVDPRTDRIYVTDGTGANYYISVLNGRTNQVIDQIPVTPSINLAIDTKTDTLYSSSILGGTLSVISGHSDRVVTTVPVNSLVSGVAVDMDSDLVYMGGYSTGKVFVFDGHTNKLIATIKIPDQPSAIVTNPGTGLAYVAALDHVSVVSEASETVTRPIKLTAPNGLGVNTTTDTIQVVRLGSLTLINGQTGKITSTTPFAPSSDDIAAVAANPRTDTTYATDESAGTVFVLKHCDA